MKTLHISKCPDFIVILKKKKPSTAHLCRLLVAGKNWSDNQRVDGKKVSLWESHEMLLILIARCTVYLFMV